MSPIARKNITQIRGREDQGGGVEWEEEGEQRGAEGEAEGETEGRAEEEADGQAKVKAVWEANQGRRG
jgi:hypothetical protein